MRPKYLTKPRSDDLGDKRLIEGFGPAVYSEVLRADETGPLIYCDEGIGQRDAMLNTAHYAELAEPRGRDARRYQRKLSEYHQWQRLSGNEKQMEAVAKMAKELRELQGKMRARAYCSSEPEEEEIVQHFQDQDPEQPPHKPHGRFSLVYSFISPSD